MRIDLNVEWRDASSADAAVVSHHRFEGRTEPRAEFEAYLAWVEPRLANGRYLGCLATHDGDVVAGAGVVLLDWGPTRGNLSGVAGRVVAVYTDPAWRRRGLAGALVRRALARAQAQGVRDFRLAASAEGANVYRSIGFEPYVAEMKLRMSLTAGR